MAHFEDYELAQSIHRELLELHARANSATSVELSVIAAKAELPPNWQPEENRATVDDARTNAWLAICRLASEFGPRFSGLHTLNGATICQTNKEGRSMGEHCERP